MIIMMLC